MADTLPQTPPPSATSIRRAVPADAAVLGALSHDTFLDTFVRGFGIAYSDWDLDQFMPKAHSQSAYEAMFADPALALWIAEDAVGAPVGYAVAGPCGLPVPGADPAHGELRRLYVIPSAQGSGLAIRLLRETLTWLRADQRPVWLGVWSGNEKAQRFYARHGFEKAGEFEYPVGKTIDAEFAMRRAAGAF